MDPKRRELVERLYRAAAAKSANERDVFLMQTCSGDPNLRPEVEALLRRQDSDATQTLVGPGDSVGPYEILGPLGAGGMGEVYRARDTRLGRPVAVKFLSSATAADRAALERFRHEAQAISALNHPNVCTIHDVGEQDGRPYLVMELLDGETLKHRIASGRLSNDQVLSTSIPILEALEAAHATGIVHRDIKPANIFLTKLGVVKILDFGLAKNSGPTSDPAGEGLTVPGTTLGTASYMSPEQARGEAIDVRSDLFSCGVVLYEMATGAKPFQGETWAKTIEAVMNRAPRPARELNRDLMPEIERVIDRTLEKDPAARYQTAADLRAELVRIKRQMEAQRAPMSSPQRQSQLRYAAIAFAVLIGAGGLAWYWRAPKSPVTVPSEFVQLTNFSDYATAPALSADGKMVAFFRGDRWFENTGPVYAKNLQGSESILLTGDPKPKYGLVFTPDGRVAYTALTRSMNSWDTWTVPMFGGAATLLMKNAAGLSWFGPDHRILFSEVMDGTAIHMGVMTARENRAEQREIYFPPHQRGMAHYSWPSPDLRSILIVEMGSTGGWPGCRVAPMSGGSAGAHVGPEGSCIAAAWSPDGRWMYFNAGVEGSFHLWRQRVPDGIPEQITFGPTEEEGLAMGPDGKWLVSSIGVRQSSVWMHDSSGERVLVSEGFVSAPQLSRDSRRLYYLQRNSNTSEGNELWSRDLVSGKSDPVLPGQPMASYQVSQDQARVVFTVRHGATSQVFLAALDRSSPPRMVIPNGTSVNFAGRGGELVFMEVGDKVNYLARIRADGSVERIVEAPILSKQGVSPNGDWAIVTGLAPGGTSAVSLRDHSLRRICAGNCGVAWSSNGEYLYVNTSRADLSGRTLVVPAALVVEPSQLPAEGLDRASDEDLAGIRTIKQGEIYPGPDPQTYMFVRAEFQGNLFRIPLH